MTRPENSPRSISATIIFSKRRSISFCVRCRTSALIASAGVIGTYCRLRPLRAGFGRVAAISAAIVVVLMVVSREVVRGQARRRFGCSSGRAWPRECA
jgi:hypothetical protein